MDIGGTFLRVVFVVLAEGKVTTRQKKYLIDDGLKVGEAQALFGACTTFLGHSSGVVSSDD